nr:2-C-methyl-D-erythritol 4-phosphate cytidylyltransferase [Candidimonas nitroreducens]
MDGDAAAAPLPKQYRLLKGEPMLRWAVRALLAEPRIAQVRVAVAAGDPWADSALAGLPRTLWRACGGPSRAATVMAALRDAAPAPADWVLVHDAARPGLPAQALARLIDTCLARGSGALLALPVGDTVKRGTAPGPAADCVLTGSDGTLLPAAAALAAVEATVPREALWLAQTPQMFRAGLLLDALLAAQSAGATVTDEASALERLGKRPALVPGSVRNFKVTWPEDFELMEKWL